MNLLISKLSGLRVLCGETINNCLPIHRIFTQATQQNDEDEEGNNNNNEQNDDPFASTSMERQAKANVKSNQNEQNNNNDDDEEEEQKHFKDDHSTHYNSKTYDSNNNSNNFEMSMSNNSNNNDEYDIPFTQMSQQIQPPVQNVFDNIQSVQEVKPKTQKKPMLGNIDEDKIKKVEKNDPVDEVDYFSQMNMGMPAASNTTTTATTSKSTKTTKKSTKKQEVKSEDLFPTEQPKESKFNMENDVHEDALDSAGWGDHVDVDDIEL